MRNPILSLTPGDKVLERYANQMVAAGDGGAIKALARAINRTAETVRGKVVRAVAKQSSIPVGRVRKEIRLRRARVRASSDLEAHIWATGSPLPLKEFKPKQFSFGVRAKVWGKMQRFPSAFIYAGTFRSGKFVGGGHVFVRTSEESKPLELMYGPSIPEEMVRGESKKAFEETVATMLPARVGHELGRILNGSAS